MQSPNPARALGLGVAVLLGASVFAFAQPTPETPVPAQMTENPMVPAARATHIAILSAANEVPPANSAGTGTAWILLDEQTNTLTWTVEFAGLSGPATGAHFHGPAQPGEAADVIISLVGGDAIGQLASPIQGTANITADQVAQLNGGMWYVNIHTDGAPGGEIRGQVVAPGAETAEAGPATTVQTALGLIYVGPNGKTLYTFDNDTAGVTNCYGGCATNWPPFMADAGAVATGDWTIVPRTDGTQMWAYDGKPVYYFANDANPGDLNGNQPTGRWHVVLAD